MCVVIGMDVGCAVCWLLCVLVCLRDCVSVGMLVCWCVGLFVGQLECGVSLFVCLFVG